MPAENPPPTVEQPTTPGPPPVPNPDQQGPEQVSATGSPTGAPATSRAQSGERGPTLLEDFHLREKIMHFDHERIPERVVHARGAGAHGVFESYGTLESDLCRPRSCSRARRTPVFTRFSTVAGSRGSADTVRDVRGLRVKFYTDEGNFDLVGNNIPVFFIQDGIKFPDLSTPPSPSPIARSRRRRPRTTRSGTSCRCSPSRTHMLMWAMSDRAIPRSYRMMEGFGVHTFRLVNAAGETSLVKFHWKPCSASTAWCGRRPRSSAASTPTSTVATSTTRSRRARSPSGSSACRSCPTPTTRCSRASTCSTRPSSCPRSCARCSRRRMTLDRNPDQLLRRDRAGGVPPRPRGAGHRRHRRPAAARPAVLLPRHPAHPSRRPELLADPDQPAWWPPTTRPPGWPRWPTCSARTACGTVSRRRASDAAPTGPARSTPAQSDAARPFRWSSRLSRSIRAPRWTA
jgi:hypothetical protein